MIQLATNTADQRVNLSLREARRLMPTFTHYLLVLSEEAHGTPGNPVGQVVTVIYENDRSTQIELTTIGITRAGRYLYSVYGQNSATNIDPASPDVVGLVEQGLATLTDGDQRYDILNQPIPSNVNY